MSDDRYSVLQQHHASPQCRLPQGLMAYRIGLLVGEEVRQEVYRGKSRSSIRGLFILLKQRVGLTQQVMAASPG
jgi:hypothetical protein